MDTHPDWTLTVEGFGPIKSASIRPAPLTLLVGKNNTGKSYMASLLWALMARSQSIASEHYDRLGPPPWLTQALQQARDEYIIVDGDGWASIAEWMTQAISKGAKELCRNALGPAVRPPKLARIIVQSYPGNRRHRIRRAPASEYTRDASDISTEQLRGPSRPGFGDLSVRAKSLTSNLADELIAGFPFHTCLYIPAARTGLLVARRTIVSGLLRALDASGNSIEQSSLPPPIAEFMLTLNAIEEPFDPPTDSTQDRIAAMIEAEILSGSVVIDPENGEIVFRPGTTREQIALSHTSSLVTELAPFVAFLRAQYLPDTIIFEEPEAHLHLDAQRTLARALVRLVNAGTRLIITTHSDTLLQQINILIHLHGHPQRERLMQEFGYQTDELLDPEKARGYLFDPTPEGTITREMEKKRGGFVEPTINSVIAEMTREIIAMQRTDAE